MGEGEKNLEICERASVGSTRVAAFPTGYHPHSDLHGIHSRSLPAPENDTISRHDTHIHNTRKAFSTDGLRLNRPSFPLGHFTPLTTNDDPADLALVHSHYSYSRSRPAIPFTTHGSGNACINFPSCPTPQPTLRRRIDYDGSRMQSTMPIGLDVGVLLPDLWLGSCMDWFGGHWSGNGFMDMAGDWRTARPGAPGRAMSCANGMARDRRASGRGSTMARASLRFLLSPPPPDPDRTTRHFSRRVDLERRIRLSFPPTPCILRQNTHLIFSKQSLVKHNARTQIPTPGRRETGSANTHVTHE